MSIALLVLSLAVSADSYAVGPVETIAEGFQFTEGPLWAPPGELIFTDIPNENILKIDGTVVRHPSNWTNGIALDTQGRLLACETKLRRVTRTEKDGSITVIAETFEGKKLNCPNDVIVRSDGAVFFTDPTYGITPEQEELGFRGAFEIAPNGTLRALARDFQAPNGIALSKDEKVLYVSDTEGEEIRRFNFDRDGAVVKIASLCKIPHPDGMAVDRKDNLWCAAKDGIRVISAKGKLLATIAVPQMPANCAFGDADGKTLYITARTGLYKVRCKFPGAKFGEK